jgi:ABC-2 type transport system permease protein
METFMMSLLKLKHLCKKELLATLKDPATRIVLIVPIILQSIIFGYAATYNLDKVPYACVDNSKSKTSIEFLSKLDGTGVFQRVETLMNAGQIARSIDSDKAMMVISIDSDFEKKLSKGETASIQVITDGRNTTTGAVALGYINDIVEELNTQKNGGKLLIKMETRTWYNPNLITRWSFMPGMIAALSLIQILMLAGLSVAREREQGTFDQLLVTPLSSTEILIGKAVPPLLLGILQVTFVLLSCVLWFKIPMSGSLLTFYLTVLIFTISCIGIGLSISAVSSSMQQVMVYTFVLIMPMILLSGLATPIRNMPEILQIATYANPMRFGVEAIRRVYLEGSTLAQIAHNFVPMAVVAIITMPLAVWLFRNKLT